MKSTTTKAAFWSLTDTYSGFALKFFFAIAITRILTPHDYGIVAYMGLFLGIAAMLSEGGFGTALIQKQDATNIDYSTGYIFNVGISVFFFVIYFILSPHIADFFNEPALKNVMRVTSINLIINSLCYIHLIKLIKAVEFKKQAIINFPSSLLSGVIGLILALKGYGYWALVYQTLFVSLFRLIGLFLIVRWKPLLKFNWLSFKEQFGFGSKVFIQGLLQSIFNEMYALIIGKTYQTTALGNYSRGKKFYDLFIIQTGIAFNKVLYPLMVKRTNDKSAHKEMYFKTYNLFFFLMAPLSLFLIVMADPIVRLLLTDKWIYAVPYMQLYFVAGFIQLLIYFNSTTIISTNKPGLFLKMDIFQKILFIIALILTYKVSIIAIITGWLIAYYMYYLAYEVLMFRQGFFSIIKYIKMLQVIFCLVPLIMIYYISKQFILQTNMLLIINLFLQPFAFFACMRIGKYEIYKDFSKILHPFMPTKLKWLV